ncbi:hypothetical protein DL98DRAFT_251028 [Cadophora sp. DSE1049]|nr:hypothetical protein DL98DRAFT_251028 [Cadophora sp. DSE1049]
MLMSLVVVGCRLVSASWGRIGAKIRGVGRLSRRDKGTPALQRKPSSIYRQERLGTGTRSKASSNCRRRRRVWCCCCCRWAQKMGGSLGM